MAQIELTLEELNMVSNNNLNGAIKMAKWTKRAVNGKKLSVINSVHLSMIAGRITEMIWDNDCYVYGNTNHWGDGVTVNFTDAEQSHLQYSITIYPEYEVELEIMDKQTNKYIYSVEY